MLQSLKIRNYALIDSLEIDFRKGFSVVTGETGAGKSIMLGAIGLVLGDRADTKAIKTGADKCCVEAVFEDESPDVATFLCSNDFDFDGTEIIVRREISKSGKSRAFINDTPATLAQLKQLGQKLIDIHSQHQNLLISGTDFQIGVLDAVAKNQVERDSYSESYVKYKEQTALFEKLRAEFEKKRNDEDYMRYSLEQIEAADLKDNELEELEAEQKMLAHAEEITETITEACRAIDNEETCMTDILSRQAENLSRIARFMPEAGETAQRLDSVCIELRDIYDELKAKADNEDFDPSRLQQVDERLSVIYDLLRKYHLDSYDALLEKQQELREQIAMIDDSTEILSAKEKECEELRKTVVACAGKLTATRSKAAKYLSEEIQRQLIPLGMPDVTFKVEVKPLPKAGHSGMDDVEFLFSANKNSALREIGTIASGGEIARIMLCLKSVVSEAKGLPTIVFDEIDTGVSGRIAEQMARTMQGIAAHGTQVVCITHLPQIAAKGECHYRVFKQNENDVTTSRIELLEGKNRMEEIAKMLSGSEITEAAINNAKELLKNK